MFKLKIIDKPKMFKLKCDFEFPQIPLENLQEKEVNPTLEKQEIVADKEYSALSKVTVNAVTNDIDNNIQANNIKKDVSILGVTGNVVELKGETKIVTPTKENQTILPSEGKNGLTSVFVEKIPDEYIIPSGEINISQNGTYDVTDEAIANVNIPEKVLGTKSITSNGTYKAVDDNLDGYSEVEVETSGVDIWDYYFRQPEGNMQSQYSSYIKKVPLVDTSNLIYAIDMFAGLSNLQEVPLVDIGKCTTTSSMFYGCKKITSIPLLNTQNVTNMGSMFQNCISLITIPLLNTSKVTNVYNMFDECVSLTSIPLLNTQNVINMSNMFGDCRSLTSIPLFNTSKVTNMGSMFHGCRGLTQLPQLDIQNATNIYEMFYNCTNLIDIPELNAQKVNNLYNTFYNCKKLTNFGGLTNLGQAYSTTASANYNNLKLDLSSCSGLTHDSLMNVINNLYDIKTKGCKTQGLILGSTNLAKLTSEEIAIATNKGWNVS